jgi:L-amino acid N-acyltransferase YncA
VFRDVGYKHRRWLDIVLMQKGLNGGGEREPEGAGLPLG